MLKLKLVGVTSMQDSLTAAPLANHCATALCRYDNLVLLDIPRHRSLHMHQSAPGVCWLSVNYLILAEHFCTHQHLWFEAHAVCGRLHHQRLS